MKSTSKIVALTLIVMSILIMAKLSNLITMTWAFILSPLWVLPLGVIAGWALLFLIEKLKDLNVRK